MIVAKNTSSNNSTIASVHSLSQFLTHGAVASNPNGERAAYLVGQKRRDDVCIFLEMVLDNSGSMNSNCGGGKSRLAVALQCIQDIVRDPTLALRAPDSFVLRTFNGYILDRLVTHPDKFNYERMLKDIEYKPGDTEKTRLWDAMSRSVSVMLDHPEKKRADKEVVRFMLVLTDGADNASKDNVESLARTLVAAKLSNFYVVVIAAGLGASALEDLERLKQLCQRKVVVRIIRVETASDVKIREAFQEAMAHIRMLMMRNKNGEVKVTTLVTKDLKQAQAYDAMAAQAMQQSYKEIRPLTFSGSNDINHLFKALSFASKK